ncbi:hypothetical protein ACI2IP_07610 [Microbacterium sp. NPDC090218]
MRRHRRTGTALVVVVSAVIVLAGCTTPPPPPGPDDWTLEPIAIDTRVAWRPGETPPTTTPPRAGDLADVSFSMTLLAADGDGGFWADSAGSFVHISGDGETLARFTGKADDRLSQIIAMASSGDDELVVARAGTAPAIAVLDTTTMIMRDVPGTAAGGGDSPLFQYVDLATRGGEAIVAHVRPDKLGYLTLEILRIDLEDGDRAVLHTEPLELTEAPQAFPDVPPVRLDVDAEGAIHLAVPSARVVLNPDGTERTRTPQTANYPQVAVRPDGTALWWGGDSERSRATSAIVGGSPEARLSIENRSSCTGLSRNDALRLSIGGAERPLPFLCGVNDAIWTGSAWVVAAGGEADGVLVRVTPPESFG